MPWKWWRTIRILSLLLGCVVYAGYGAVSLLLGEIPRLTSVDEPPKERRRRERTSLLVWLSQDLPTPARSPSPCWRVLRIVLTTGTVSGHLHYLEEKSEVYWAPLGSWHKCYSEILIPLGSVSNFSYRRYWFNQKVALTLRTHDSKEVCFVTSKRNRPTRGILGKLEEKSRLPK